MRELAPLRCPIERQPHPRRALLLPLRFLSAARSCGISRTCFLRFVLLLCGILTELPQLLEVLVQRRRELVSSCRQIAVVLLVFFAVLFALVVGGRLTTRLLPLLLSQQSLPPVSKLGCLLLCRCFLDGVGLQ